MRHARRRIVRRVTRLMAAGGLLLGAGMVTQAVAGEPPGTAALPRGAAPSAADTGTALVDRLGGSRTAGSWIGADGRTVVAVTDADAASEVRRAGAEPREVRHSMSDLRTATAALGEQPRVAGTSWAVDYKSNEVVVRGDRTVSRADWSRLTGIAEGLGGFVRMERTEGTFTARLNGALPILSTAGRCSAGFNVTDGTRDYILTAGHCGPLGSVWFADGRGTEQIGRTVRGSFPGDDYSLVQYAAGRAGEGAEVVAIGDGQGVRITGVDDASVGQRVFRSGSTSGLRDGRVTALDATVNYPEGTVTGLIETDVCAEPGDSGGPLFSEGIALGITSGGDGDCATGGTTFFEPVTTTLEELGMRLIAAAPQPGAGEPSPAAVAPGAASPGSRAPVVGGGVAAVRAWLTDRENAGPGLLIIAGSVVALVATRFIRAEQDRRAYRHRYSATWG
ncbi:S1 family peptidase [Streptomyces sp. NPDC004610]|uniref:S1 family peptidase n=1 Tax=unclassified Streptomyces TaxID=2593676 RepID=UPI0033BBE9F9